MFYNIVWTIGIYSIVLIEVVIYGGRIGELQLFPPRCAVKQTKPRVAVMTGLVFVAQSGGTDSYYSQDKYGSIGIVLQVTTANTYIHTYILHPLDDKQTLLMMMVVGKQTVGRKKRQNTHDMY